MCVCVCMDGWIVAWMYAVIYRCYKLYKVLKLYELYKLHKLHNMDIMQTGRNARTSTFPALASERKGQQA